MDQKSYISRPDPIFREVIRPKAWMDGGVDQYWVEQVNLIVAMLEFKCYPYRLKEKYYWTPKRRKSTDKKPENMPKWLLQKSSNQIQPLVVCSSVELPQMEILRYEAKSGIQHPFQTLGKGCVFWVCYPKCYSCLSVVNVTGSKTILNLHEKLLKACNDKNTFYGYLSKFKSNLEKIGKELQPCISQFVWFMIEAFVRQDFDIMYDYVLNGITKGKLRLRHDGDKELLSYLKNGIVIAENKENIKWLRRRWFGDMIYTLLRIIHIDDLLTHDGLALYKDLVKTVRGNSTYDGLFHFLSSAKYKLKNGSLVLADGLDKTRLKAVS